MRQEIIGQTQRVAYAAHFVVGKITQQGEGEGEPREVTNQHPARNRLYVVSVLCGMGSGFDDEHILVIRRKVLHIVA